MIPIDDKGQLSEAFNMRIDELNVIDMVFLEGCAKPTIAVLYQDNKDARHIKTYEVVVKEKVGHPPWVHSRRDTSDLDDDNDVGTNVKQKDTSTTFSWMHCNADTTSLSTCLQQVGKLCGTLSEAWASWTGCRRAYVP